MMVVLKFLFCFLLINSYFLLVALYKVYTVKLTRPGKCIANGTTYADLLQSECFVDKSLLIKEFLNTTSHIIHVTAPSGFGKSSNMEMLKSFLINEDKKEYDFFEDNITPGCKLFKSNNLNIFTYDYGRFFNMHCGKYPVIHVNFKGMNCSSFNKILDRFLEVMIASYKEHAYLMHSAKLDADQKDILSVYTDTDSNSFVKLDKIALHNSLHYLLQMLYTHFGKKVIVLIDDYDSPIWSILKNPFPEEDLRKTIEFMNKFTSSFVVEGRNNINYVYKALINSCLRFEGFLTEQRRSVTHFPVFGQHPFVGYYGLIFTEVSRLLDKLLVRFMVYGVADYYNGYVTTFGTRLYRTLSIINCMSQKRIRDYFLGEEGFKKLDLLFLQSEMRRSFRKLINWDTITINTTGKITIDEIIILKDMITQNRTCNWKDVEIFLNFLLNLGYFNPTRTQSDFKVSLQIPNKEAFHHLYDSFFSELYLEGNCNLQTPKINAFLDELDLLDSVRNKSNRMDNLRDTIKHLFSNLTAENDVDSILASVYYLFKKSTKFGYTSLEHRRDIDGKIGQAHIITIRNRDNTGIIIEARYTKLPEEGAPVPQTAQAGYYELLNLADKSTRETMRRRVAIGLFVVNGLPMRNLSKFLS